MRVIFNDTKGNKAPANIPFIHLLKISVVQTYGANVQKTSVAKLVHEKVL